jgi:tetratricopeptide (TPR) repeat protein
VLAVLIAMLFGVIFLLPKTVTIDEAQPVTAGDEGAVPAQAGARRPGVEFSENIEDLSGRDERVQARGETEVVLGELLSRMDTLERRAVARWGGLRFKQAQSVYAEGDTAYLARDYATAADKYRQAIDIVDPLLEEVDEVFATTFANARSALDAGDSVDALQLFELAVAISPGHAGAKAGYDRARNLDTVRAVEIDPEWQPASAGLARVLETIKQMEFDQRMTEGLAALADRDFLGARAAFRMARQLKPDSPEPADGMLQVDQGIRLVESETLERKARAQEESEQWDTAIETYEAILELDANLEFAQGGLNHARQMAALHQRLDEYIANPDKLSVPVTMQAATKLIVDITRMPSIGPRLGDQRDELTRLLKRAATPLRVQIVSDNLTDVSIYKVGKLGSFSTQELNLRPGTYVAVGSRPGYRDVRLEFHVAPEIDLEPVVVRCEEPI